MVLWRVRSKLSLLTRAVAQLVGAKLLVATHVVDARLVVAKLGLTIHMGKHVRKMVVPILVEVEEMSVKLLVVCLFPLAGGVEAWGGETILSSRSPPAFAIG